MTYLIACPPLATIAGAAAIVVAVLSAAALAAKALFNHLRNGSAPSTWHLVAVTVAEPIAYLVTAVAYAAAAQKIWGLQDAFGLFAALGALVVYLGSTGIHAKLLVPDGRVGDRWRRLGWSLAYALVIPGLVAAIGAFSAF